MQKKWIIGIVLGALTYSQTWAQETAVGVWQTFDEHNHSKKAMVRITRQADGKLIGTIIRLQQKPGAKCINCQGKQKNQPIEGMKIMWGLSADGENQWHDGHILDPQNGKTYSLKMTLSPDGQKLTLRGYLGFSLFGRTQTWQRVH